MFTLECAGRSESFPVSLSADDMRRAAQNIANIRQATVVAKGPRGKELFRVEPTRTN